MMKKFTTLILLFLFLTVGNVFAGKISTRSTMPTECSVGDLWINPSGAAYNRIYTCTATNTWTLNAGSGGVTSVNSQTGAVVLDADDIDDTGTTNKFTTSAEKSTWNGKQDALGYTPQQRVTGTCTAGSSIREIASDGTVTCETDDTGSGSVPDGTVDGQVLLWVTDQWVASTFPGMLESGSYTPTGTWNWTSATVTWPTFNQNTTGTSGGLSGTPDITVGTINFAYAYNTLGEGYQYGEVNNGTISATATLGRYAFSTVDGEMHFADGTDWDGYFIRDAHIGVPGGVQAYDANMIQWPSAIDATEVGYLDGLTELLAVSLGNKIGSTGVTFENLNINGDVGSGSDQVAAGNHTHAGVYEPSGTTATHASLTSTHGVTGSIVGTTDTQTLTGKTIDTAATGNNITVPLNGLLDDSMLNPTASDAISYRKIQHAITLTGINCQAEGGGTITLTLQECSSTNTSCTDIENAITCDSDGATDDGVLTDPSLAVGGWIRVVPGTPSGTVTGVSWNLIGTQTW